jgi:hypothetical protein
MFIDTAVNSFVLVKDFSEYFEMVRLKLSRTRPGLQNIGCVCHEGEYDAISFPVR